MAKAENLKYIDFSIGVLHLELTSRCNALCPMCARTTGLDHDGKNAPGYEIMKAIVQLGCRTAIKISEKL